MFWNDPRRPIYTQPHFLPERQVSLIVWPTKRLSRKGYSLERCIVEQRPSLASATNIRGRHYKLRRSVLLGADFYDSGTMRE